MDSIQKDIAIVSGIEVVPRILDVVCRLTGMGFAAVARVTEDRWVACSVLDHVSFGLQPGGELKLDSTLCDEIRQSGCEIVIDHVAEDPVYRDHHTPRIYGLQSYISIPIKLSDGRFFGTLCAIDPKPAQLKRTEIVETFRLFAQLIASHIETAERLTTTEGFLQQERETAELREQFIAVLGHDLRNPLGAISSAAAVLAMAGRDERTTRLSDIIQSSVRRMSGLIENVLDFTRGRLGGGISLANRPETDLRPVLEQVLGEIQTAWPDRAITAEFEIDHPVSCDPSRIGQLFSNLLGNAISHGRTEAHVKVRAVSSSDAFELSVTNACDPIPDATLKRLFLPFSRGDASDPSQGLGLGLYISSEIAKAHGGTLEVHSDPEETRFTFRMPLVAGH